MGNNRIKTEQTGRNDYATPWPVIRFLEKFFNIKFDLDPCCYPHTAKAKNYFTKEDDGLSKNWFGNVFMNPEWEQPLLSQFIKHAYEQSLSGNTKFIAGLIPAASPDTHAWHNYVIGGASFVYDIRGRIPFELDGIRKNDNNVPTCVAIWTRTRPGIITRLGSFDSKEMMAA